MLLDKYMQDLIKAVAAWCQEQPVRLAVLFGSQATGQTHTRSDVDLALWPATSLSTAALLRWISELEILLGQDVSLVVVTADLDPVLGMEIVRHGCLIYECEPGLWPYHRAQLWHAYNDSLPFLRIARQRLHEFAEEVRRGS
jgi:predicted nucleotidyltransferase